MTEDRKRLLRGSFDRQTSQSQHSEGTPVEVPVPKNRISIKIFIVAGPCPERMVQESIKPRKMVASQIEFCSLGRALCSSFAFVPRRGITLAPSGPPEER